MAVILFFYFCAPFYTFARPASAPVYEYETGTEATHDGNRSNSWRIPPQVESDGSAEESDESAYQPPLGDDDDDFDDSVLDEDFAPRRSAGKRR
jgi:hypothetical protein